MRALEKRAAVSDLGCGANACVVQQLPLSLSLACVVCGVYGVWCVQGARCKVRRCKGQDRTGEQLWLVNHPALAGAKWSNWGWKEGQAPVWLSTFGRQGMGGGTLNQNHDREGM